MRYHEHKVEGNAQVLKGALPTKYIKRGEGEIEQCIQKSICRCKERGDIRIYVFVKNTGGIDKKLINMLT